MPRTTTLTIAQPCHESWAAMAPTARGRHCAACQKTVVDFTAMTDPEILAYLGQSAGGACGRFRAGQLGRPLQPLPLAPAGHWRTWALSLAALLGLRELLAPAARAQQAPVEQTARKPIDMKRDFRTAPEAPAEKVSIIRGQVLDKQTNEGLPGVTVLMAGSTVGTSTNSDGTFELALAEYAEAERVELQFRYVGYVTEQRTVLLNARAQTLQVGLDMDMKGGLEITIVPPAPWRPRAFYNWGKYWITRPFRR